MAVKLGDGVAISFYDITERKRHEAELSYQAFLLANMSDAVFIVDLDRHITHWNHGAEALYGWPAAEAIGRPAPDILRTTAATETITARLGGVADGVQNHFEAVHNSRTGELLYVESTATAICTNGVLTGYLIINRNITDRFRHEQELQQLNASLAQLNATLEQRVRERTAELERSNRELAEHLPNSAVYIFDADLRVVLAGDSLMAKSRWPREALLGRSLADLMPPVTFAQAEPHLRAALGGREQA